MPTHTTLGCMALMLLLTPAAAHAQIRHEWYVGGHAGAMAVRIDYDEPERPEFSREPRNDGGVGGLLAGYDRQSGRLLLGLEGDITRGSVDLDPGDRGGNRYTAIDIGWQTRLRARAGAAWGAARVFAAAGFATARVTVDDVDAGFGGASARHFGWTAGAGFDYALAGMLRLRAEYLFDHYGTERYAITSPPGEFFPRYVVETAFTAHTARAAAVYRF